MSKGGGDSSQADALQNQINRENAEERLLTKQAYAKELDIFRSNGGDKYVSNTPGAPAAPIPEQPIIPSSVTPAMPAPTAAPTAAPTFMGIM